MPGASVGNIWAALRVDGSQASADAVGAASGAGEKAGKTLGDRFKASFTKANVGKGIAAGLGLGTGLAAFDLIKGGVQAVAGAITDSVNASKEFDDQLRTINTVAGVSDAQLGRIGDRIQALSRETGKSTDDLTAGFYDLVSAGIPAENAMQVLKDSAILATGALGTTGETVDLLTSTLNAYGMEASQSTRLTDIFAKAVADGKVTAAELGTSIANIAPIAASAGISIEEVAAGYAQLTKNGVPAAQAATQMRSAISALLTPNAQLAAIQKKVNVNFADMARSQGLGVALQALREAAGSDEALAKALGSVEALGATLLITGDNAGSFAAELKGVEDAATKGGVALGQYTEKSKSAAEQQARFDAEVHTLQQDIGELIQPIYKALVVGATLVIQTIRALGDAFHNFERFLSPHLAAIEDTDRALIDLAQQYGLSEDALLTFADAHRKAAEAADEARFAVKTLQDLLVGMTDQDAKNTLVASLVVQLKALADQAGKPLELALTTLQGELGDTALTAENAGAFMKLVAADLGIVTDAAGKVVPQLDAATAALHDFLTTPEKLKEAGASLAAWARDTYGPALSDGIAAGVDPRPVIVRIDRLKDQLEPAVASVIDEYARYLQDHAARIELPHSVGILEQIKKDLRQAAKDLQWELDHPAAWDKLTGTIQARIKKLMARAAEEDEKGNTHQVEILQRGTTNLIGIWEETTGLSWDYGLGTTDNFRRGTLKDLKGIETAADKVKGRAVGGLNDPARFKAIGSDTIVKYASGMTDENATYWLNYALGKVAGSVSSFLETHSPADEGPLSLGGGPEGYGRGLVTKLATGMLGGLSDLASASSQVAGALSLGLSYPSLPSYGAMGGSLSLSGEQTVRVVHEWAPGTAADLRSQNYDDRGIMRLINDGLRGASDSAHIGSLKPRGA